MCLRIEGDAMVHLWVLGEEIFQYVSVFVLTRFQRQVHVGDFYLWKMVVHVRSEPCFAVFLLLTYHFSVFGLFHNCYFAFVVSNHHEHFCSEISTAERVLPIE